jgi:hypothetical protein
MEIQPLPQLSSSVASSSDYSPKTDLGSIHIDPEIFQSPSRRRPMDSSAPKLKDTSFDLPSSSPPSFPIPPSSSPPHLELLSPKQRTLEAHMRMRCKFEPYKVPGASPLELRFAMRSLGRSSYHDIRFEDAIAVGGPYFVYYL